MTKTDKSQDLFFASFYQPVLSRGELHRVGLIYIPNLVAESYFFRSPTACHYF